MQFQPQAGVPQAPIHRLTASEVDDKEYSQAARLVSEAWCPTQLLPGHPSLRFSETLEYCRTSMDPVTYSSPVTEHVPVLHFHAAQLARCRAHGVFPPIAEGPCQYDMPQPRTWQEMHRDPSRSWLRGMRYVQDTRRQLRKIEDGMQSQRQPHRFRHDEVEGNGDAVEYGPADIVPPFAAVQWKDVNGRPVMVTPDLPDSSTELDVDAMYADAVTHGLNDMEAASEAALYGTIGDFAASATTQLIPAYAGAYEYLDILQEERTKKLTLWRTPRLNKVAKRLRGYPIRTHPKSVLLQPKPGGKVKKRPITDAGAVRQRRQRITAKRKRRQWRSLQQAREDVRKAEIMQRAGVVVQEDDAEFHEQVSHFFAKKGAAGVDSVNATVRVERQAECVFGDIHAFCRGVDILRSSGLAVDTVIDDFVAYYEMWGLAMTEQWAMAQLISSAGMDGDPRGSFGLQYLPNKLNRQNYNITDIIHIELMAAQREFCWTPWSPETKAAALTFSATRRVYGQSGQWFYQLPWFDDNSACVLHHFTQQLKDIRYRIWGRFNLEWAIPKAAINLFGTKAWMPVIGFDIRAKERVRGLPAEKVAKYSARIDTVVAAVETHPKRLVEISEFDGLMGQLCHAADVIPSLWGDFMLLVSLTGNQGFRRYTLVHIYTVTVLRRIQLTLKVDPGSPLSPYTRRPGADGLRVWTAFTDASTRTPTCSPPLFSV